MATKKRLKIILLILAAVLVAALIVGIVVFALNSGGDPNESAGEYQSLAVQTTGKAVFRADAYGWGDASYNGTFETSWTDWNAWLQLMTDADVTLVMSRSGGVVTADITFTGADGTEMTEKATITSTMTADSPCWFFLTGEACYIEILSVA